VPLNDAIIFITKKLAKIVLLVKHLTETCHYFIVTKKIFSEIKYATILL
jgi:hypothetical protein